MRNSADKILHNGVSIVPFEHNFKGDTLVGIYRINLTMGDKLRSVKGDSDIHLSLRQK